jgi:hypothetical protein
MLDTLKNLRLFVKHVSDVGTLRRLTAEKGDGYAIFGGKAVTTFADVTALMKRNPDKVAWFYAPVDRLSDYFTEGYMPFQAHGPDHLARRSAIVARNAMAHGRLGELESLLAASPDADTALLRFFFRTMVDLEISDEEVQRVLDYRKWAAPLSLLSPWIRRSAFAMPHRRMAAHRAHFLARLTAAKVLHADSWWDVLWFQSATLSFYPERALEALRAQPALQAAITAELANAPSARPSTRALVLEVMRLHCRIASANYREGGEVKIAMLPVACMDPARYAKPEEIDLTRDQSDALAFAVSSPRGCPAHALAPDMMAAVVAHRVRTGALDAKS